MSGGYGKRRRKLKNHDAGHDRHNKGLAWIRKRRRAESERSGLNRKRRPSAPETSDQPEGDHT